MSRAAAIVLGGSIAVFASCGRSDSGVFDSQFRERIVAMNTALARADTAEARRYFADDLVWWLGAFGQSLGKGELLRLAGTPQDPRPEFVVDSVRVRPFGDVAVVEYQRTDHRRVGGFEFPTVWGVSEIYVRHGGEWLLAQHAMWAVHLPAATGIPMDSASMAAFVGRYEIHPDYIDSVHFEGRALVAMAVGQVSPGVWRAFTPGGQLVPVAPDAFVPDGVGSLIVFERDSRGRVIDYVQGYPNGFVSHARRLR